MENFALDLTSKLYPDPTANLVQYSNLFGLS